MVSSTTAPSSAVFNASFELSEKLSRVFERNRSLLSPVAPPTFGTSSAPAMSVYPFAFAFVFGLSAEYWVFITTSSGISATSSGITSSVPILSFASLMASFAIPDIYSSMSFNFSSITPVSTISATVSPICLSTLNLSFPALISDGSAVYSSRVPFNSSVFFA